MKTKNILFCLTIGLVMLSLCAEAEARRKILRGRQVITRTYNKGLAVPAWSIVLMCGIGMIILGGLLYVAMYKMILSESKSEDINMIPVYTAAATRDDDES
ncbi:uncharacterized protein LOC113372648 [Ctenocephalides felis]|uniref:uncharacterized protein LOC113372648 n=1 Tax=Ctenocephalides felis TaxID=7515 RepID=UPI000E6E4021|nr:uncharacterized protein LOC113372648 [Ctenocephalides felis]